MFQVNETRSRQKPSGSKCVAAAATSRRSSAAPKLASQADTAAVGDASLMSGSSLVGVYGLRSRGADRRPSDGAAPLSRPAGSDPGWSVSSPRPPPNEPIGERA